MLGPRTREKRPRMPDMTRKYLVRVRGGGRVRVRGRVRGVGGDEGRARIRHDEEVPGEG